MTISVALVSGGHLGKQASSPLVVMALDVTLDNSYPTDGWAFDAPALARSKGVYDKTPTVLDAVIEQKAGYSFAYDKTNKKIKAFQGDLDSFSLTSAGLAIGSSSKAKVLIGNTVTFLITGLFYSKTTAEVAFTATTHDIAANASTVQEAYYVLTLNSSGTPTITKGATANTGAGLLPTPPANEAVIGYVRIRVAAGATSFDASTDELDEAHLTVAYTNASFLPSQKAAFEVPNATDLSTTPGTIRVLVFHG